MMQKKLALGLLIVFSFLGIHASWWERAKETYQELKEDWEKQAEEDFNNMSHDDKVAFYTEVVGIEAALKDKHLTEAEQEEIARTYGVDISMFDQNDEDGQSDTEVVEGRDSKYSFDEEVQERVDYFLKKPHYTEIDKEGINCVIFDNKNDAEEYLIYLDPKGEFNTPADIVAKEVLKELGFTSDPDGQGLTIIDKRRGFLKKLFRLSKEKKEKAVKREEVFEVSDQEDEVDLTVIKTKRFGNDDLDVLNDSSESGFFGSMKEFWNGLTKRDLQDLGGLLAVISFVANKKIAVTGFFGTTLLCIIFKEDVKRFVNKIRGKNIQEDESTQETISEEIVVEDEDLQAE